MVRSTKPVPGFVSHLDLQWADPRIARFLEKLASFSRLILFDKRGSGLSDPVAAPDPLEDRMDDVHAVMDAAGSERAALFGLSEGGPMSVLFAATYPERTRALNLHEHQIATAAACASVRASSLKVGPMPLQPPQGSLPSRWRAFATTRPRGSPRSFRAQARYPS
jgi:pimeloyl-ACP methyl ester carboxylesterase